MENFFKSEFYNKLCSVYSHDRVKKTIDTLYELEKPRGYSAFRDSTAWCKEVLEKAGLSDVRRIAHKADGETASFDFIMPQAWDLCGRSTLSIVEPVNEVIADTDIDTIFVSEYSAPTPEGGVTAELVDFADLDENNPDCKGKFVFHRGYLPPQHPRFNSLAAAGCAGVVFAAFETTTLEPENPTWTNGHGHIGWYHLKEDPVVPVFCVTPKKGIELLELLAKGKVVMHGEMNTRLYDGEMYTITATIPGKSEDEFAILAHLYEPFHLDDCLGFGAGVEVAIMLKKLIDDGVLPKPEKTLRLIFSMERYGFAAFFANHDKKILAATSIDSMTGIASDILKLGFRVVESPLSLPFFGDMLFNEMMNTFCPDVYWNLRPGTLSDDCWMGENTVDIPTNWCVSGSVGKTGDYHHCSAPIFDEVQYDNLAKITPMLAAATAVMICADKEKFAALAEKLEKTAAYWLETEKNYVAGRAAMGKLSAQDAAWEIKKSEMLYMGRMESFNRFYPGITAPELPAHWADDFCKNLPERELSEAEKRANSIKYRIKSVGIPFSQAKIPAQERVSWPDSPELVWALLSPERTLLDAIRLRDAAFSEVTSDETINYYIEHFAFWEKYGYIEKV